MAFPTGHALLIGIGTYQNVPRLNVPVTAADAQELATILQNPQYCGYPPEQVTLLHDQSATHAGILQALDTLKNTTTEDDTVLLFYSGHGELGADGETYYLTTYDMQKDAQRKVIDGTALRQDELLLKLRDIKAKRLILLFNACHSGEISPVLDGEAAADVGEGAQSLPDSTAAAILATGEGRIIITACREQQYAFIGSGPCTIFTQALADGLRGKGTSSNGGFISAFDLYTYIYYAVDRALQKIPLATRKQYAGGVQQPELTVLKGIGPMPVALYKGQSATLSDFDSNEELDEQTAVSRIEKKYSDRMLGSFISISIGDTKIAGRDNKQAGRDMIEKSAGGDLIEAGGNVNKADGDIIGGHKIDGDYVGGDKVAGDKIGGDKIDASRSQGFINRPTGSVTQRTITTGGGDYAEGNIDKRGSRTVQGDNIEISNSTLQGVNIKSTLQNVTQQIGTIPSADQATKDELKRLVEQLSAELQKVAPEQQRDANTITKRVETVVDEVGKPDPDQEAVAFNLTSLQKAASNIGQVLPLVLTIATQIAAHISKLLG